MYSDPFEKAFDSFIDRHEYDHAEAALFSIVRIAFIAGWRAAGGDPPCEEKVVRLVHRGADCFRSAEVAGEIIKTELTPE